jgi:hypothetical protein
MPPPPPPPLPPPRLSFLLEVVATSFPGLSSKRLKAFKVALKALHKMSVPMLSNDECRVDFHALMAPIIAPVMDPMSTVEVGSDVKVRTVKRYY